MSSAVSKIVGDGVEKNPYLLSVIDPEGSDVTRLPDDFVQKTATIKCVTSQDVAIDSNGRFTIVGTMNPACALGLRSAIPLNATASLGSFQQAGPVLRRCDLDDATCDDDEYELDCNPEAVETFWFTADAGALDRGPTAADATVSSRFDVYSQDFGPGFSEGQGLRKHIPIKQTASAVDYTAIVTASATTVGAPGTGDNGPIARWIKVDGTMYLTQPYGYGVSNGAGWWQFRPNQTGTIGFVGFDWGSEPLVVTSFQGWVEWKAAVAMENCRAILFEQATPFPVLQDSVSKWRAIGMSMLVTQLSSNLNQGGQVAVYNEQNGQIPSDSSHDLASYDSILEQPYDRYDGNLADGCYCFAKPGPMLRCTEWHRIGHRGPYANSYIIVAGKIASGEDGRVIRVRHVLTLELRSDSQTFSYQSGVVAPEWMTSTRRVLAPLIPATANGLHLGFLKKIWDNAKPLAKALLPVAGQVVGPKAAVLTNLASSLL